MDTWIVLSVLQALAGAPALAGETVQRQPEDSAVIRRSLDGAWFFRKDPKGEGLEQGWHSEAISDSRWSPIRVPGHWEPQGHKGYDGVGWYRRTFDVPAADGAGRWGLCLLGVDDRARVWVNGQEVGAISQAFRRFAVDVTGVVRAGSNTLAVRVEDAGGDGGIVRSVYLGRSEELDALLRGPHHGKPARASANWVRDAVIYEVYLRSFSTEGTFKGLEHRLDELKNLGVTVLWLMPVHPVGQVKRKGTLGSPYSVKDFYAVNDEFGRMEDFKSLLSAVHQRGMKLIIDWVANHTAWDNPLVTQHPDWYHRDEQGQIRPPVPDWSDVAHLDYSKQAVRRYMADALLYWVRDVG
ncbi:MAG: alpha-amylase family glycosyl hydrolase, partial [Phycisphaerae bacterium]